MSLHDRLDEIIRSFGQRRAGGIDKVAIHAPDCWSVEIAFTTREKGSFTVRNLREGDVPAMREFGAGLGPVAKHLFCPYPWQEEEKLDGAFLATIAQSVQQVDASYLLWHEGAVIGHFFLWKAGGNPHSQMHGVEVPELGVAVIDRYQGQGFGGLSVRVLQAVAESLGADAVELTTEMGNDAGWQTYQRAGFVYTGIIRNPLDVDVTAVAAGEAVATRYREERQMVYLINSAREEAVLQYLALKRSEAAA
ncbi:MAG: GNAT family N-acetyltransferase [Armatimonadota bacterium]